MTKQAGVLNMEFFSARVVYFNMVGRSSGTLSNISSRIITMAVPEGPMFFCAPA